MAAAKPTKQETRSPIQGLDLDGVMHHLVAAHTTFQTVVSLEQLPLIWDSELAFARDRIMNDTQDKLRLCVPHTLTQAMQNLAHVGLTLNPLKQHATLIARWNDKAKVLECNCLVMYRGLVYLATQAGVHDVETDVVYKADQFNIGRDRNGGYVEHQINVMVPRGEADNFFIGAYVIAMMPGSTGRKAEWIPREDIFAMRDQSDSYLDKDSKPRPNSPWVRWFDEMAKKGALKRASKRWEEAIDHGSKWQRFQSAVQMDNEQERGGRTFDVEAEEAPKLTLQQIGAIESAASQVFLNNTEAQHQYLGKICKAYGVDVLANVAASKHKEILDRIAVAKSEQDKRRKSKP